jgi:hypothetical protein
MQASIPNEGDGATSAGVDVSGCVLSAVGPASSSNEAALPTGGALIDCRDLWPPFARRNVYDSCRRGHPVRECRRQGTRVSGSSIAESHVEEAMLGWLAELGYETAYGPHVEPEKLGAERDDFTEVVLTRRLRAALKRINPTLPASALDDALRKVLVTASPSLVENNHRFHRMLVDGIDVEYARPDHAIAGDQAWLVDFDDAEAND